MTRPTFEINGSTVAVTLAVASYLKPLLEGKSNEIDKVKTVERHIGKFDTDEDIKRYMSDKDGGVRIVASKVRNIHNAMGRGLVGTVSLAAFVFASDAYGYSRDTRAEVIASRLAGLLLADSADDITGAEGRPIEVNSDNLYDVKVDKKGIAIWAVTWLQEWRLDLPIHEADLDDFLRANVSQEIAPDAPLNESIINVREHSND